MGAVLLLLVLADTFAVGYLLSQNKQNKRLLVAQSEILQECAASHGMYVQQAVMQSVTEEGE